MNKKKLLLVLLSFGLVFSYVLAEEIINERYVGSDIETVNDAYTDLTEEEAIKKKNELERNDHDYKVTVVIKSYVVKVGEDKITINKEFNSKEDAQSYLDSLVKQGYKISSSNITSKMSTIDVSLKESFDTIEEAKKALDEFKENNNVKDSDVKITKVRDKSKDTIIRGTGTVKYDTLEEANKIKESLSRKLDDYEVYGEIRTGTIKGTKTEEIELKRFDNREDALNYIEKLKKEGLDVSELRVKLLSYEEPTWRQEKESTIKPDLGGNNKFRYGHLDIVSLTKFNKIDDSGAKTPVGGRITISEVYVDGKQIKMNKLSLDLNSNKFEYPSESRYDLNITNNSLVRIVGSVVTGDASYPFEVEGYLNEEQNVCKNTENRGFDLEFKDVTIVNDKALVDTKLVNKYSVVSEITKDFMKKVYYVDTIMNIYGYKYEVDAVGTSKTEEKIYLATGEAIKDIEETRYSLDIITETKKYEKIYGKLIVKYVDTNGKELTKMVETSEIVGTKYKTSKKQFKGYKFIKVIGDNEEGKYIDGILTITYVYEYVDGEGGNIVNIDLPITGITNDNTLEYFTIFSIVVLISAIIIRKKIV